MNKKSNTKYKTIFLLSTIEFINFCYKEGNIRYSLNILSTSKKPKFVFLLLTDIK